MKTRLALISSGMFFLSSAAFASAPLASGKVSLAPSLKDQAKGIRTLFISVYDSAQKGGPAMPYGAMKVDLKEDVGGEVQTFKLTPENMMIMGGGEVPAKLDIKAKLDRDGSAGRDGAGDLVGWAKGVKKGAEGIAIKIDTAVK